MADFTISVPNELLPALQAEFLIVSSTGATAAATAEEYFAASVIETLRQRCETYKVGPYYVGALEPKFLADGSPNPAYDGTDAIVLPEPEPEPDAPVEDPAGEEPATEPEPEVI
jgi:hypothetical protein